MTLYAQIKGGVINVVAPLPTGAGYGPDGKLHDYSKQSEVDAYIADGGWTLVTEAVRPLDTATHTYTLSYSVINGVATQVWTATPKSGSQIMEETSAANKTSLDQKVRDAIKVDGSLKALLGTGTDVAPALTNAAIKVATLRALNKLTVAEMGANAGPILNRLINIMIDLVIFDRQSGKLTVNLFDEGQ